VAGFCEHGYEPSGFIKIANFLTSWATMSLSVTGFLGVRNTRNVWPIIFCFVTHIWVCSFTENNAFRQRCVVNIKQVAATFSLPQGSLAIHIFVEGCRKILL
jgi:hypothetical protein